MYRCIYSSFSIDADKLILFFTTVSNQYVPSNDHQAFNMVLRNVTQLNQARGNSVVISSYYNGPFPLNRERLADLVNQPIVSQSLAYCVGLTDVLLFRLAH